LTFQCKVAFPYETGWLKNLTPRHLSYRGRGEAFKDERGVLTFLSLFKGEKGVGGMRGVWKSSRVIEYVQNEI